MNSVLSLPLVNLIKPISDDLANLAKETVHRGVVFTMFPFPVEGPINLMTASHNAATDASFITSPADGCRVDGVGLLVIKDAHGKVKVVPAKQLEPKTRGGSPLAVGYGEHFLKASVDEYNVIRVDEHSEQVIGYYLTGERANLNHNSRR